MHTEGGGGGIQVLSYGCVSLKVALLISIMVYHLVSKATKVLELKLLQT